MNLQNSMLTKPNISKEQASVNLLHLSTGYITCVSMGLLFGVLSTALVFSLAIIAQLLWVSNAIFSPGLIPFAITSAVMGLGVSWLFGQVAHRFLPGLFDTVGRPGVAIIAITGLVTSLVQTVLFMFVL